MGPTPRCCPPRHPPAALHPPRLPPPTANRHPHGPPDTHHAPGGGQRAAITREAAQGRPAQAAAHRPAEVETRRSSNLPSMEARLPNVGVPVAYFGNLFPFSCRAGERNWSSRRGASTRREASTRRSGALRPLTLVTSVTRRVALVRRATSRELRAPLSPRATVRSGRCPSHWGPATAPACRLTPPPPRPSPRPRCELHERARDRMFATMHRAMCANLTFRAWLAKLRPPSDPTGLGKSTA